MATLKKEPECTNQHPSSKTTTRKLYHKNNLNYKRINLVKNVLLGNVIAFLLDAYGWIICDTALQHTIGLIGWAVMVYLVLGEIDKFLNYMILGGTYE